MRKLACLLLFLPLLAACNIDHLTGKVTQPFTKKTEVTETLEKQYRIKAAISFKMHNGRYQFYNIIINENPSNLSPEEVKQAIRTVLDATYDKRPANVYVSYKVDWED